MIAVMLTLASACRPTKVQPEPQPPVITDTEHCAPACVHLMELGCEEGFPIAVPDPDFDGGTRSVSCAEWCKSTQDNGVWLNPTCVEKITSCGQIESCAVAKGKQK